MAPRADNPDGSKLIAPLAAVSESMAGEIQYQGRIDVGAADMETDGLVQILAEFGSTEEGGRGGAPLKTAAFSQYPRCPADHSASSVSTHVCLNSPAADFDFMGFAARTQDWRYVEWVKWNGTTLAPVWEEVVARELYDHRLEASYPTDFDTGELVNLAPRPEHNATIERLSRLLRAQFGTR